jgi:hypothetical protein
MLVFWLEMFRNRAQYRAERETCRGRSRSMAAMVMAAVAAGAVVAGSFAFSGHPPLVWCLAYVLSGASALLAVALQAGRAEVAKRPV